MTRADPAASWSRSRPGISCTTPGRRSSTLWRPASSADWATRFARWLP